MTIVSFEPFPAKSLYPSLSVSPHPWQDSGGLNISPQEFVCLSPRHQAFVSAPCLACCCLQEVVSGDRNVSLRFITEPGT